MSQGTTSRGPPAADLRHCGAFRRADKAILETGTSCAQQRYLASADADTAA